MLQILTPSGNLLGEPPIDLDLTCRLYKAMVFARAFDRRAVALEKQGSIAGYYPFEGQEAAQVGSAAALEPDDWLVPSHRDLAAMWMQGYPMDLLFRWHAGDERGGHSPEGVNVLPPTTAVAGHLSHAVGLAWAERLKGNERVAIAYFGDGATTDGGFHESLNLAALFKLGVVFFCQNNGYSLSTPGKGLMVSASIAEKALGYGVPGIQVDGNDLFGVFKVVDQAVQRARIGKGPTLIEAVTYRVGPHTVMDDPSRYRSSEEVEAWKAKDPLERVRVYLSERDRWDLRWQERLDDQAGAEIDRATKVALHHDPVSVDEVMNSVFASRVEVGS
jgi:pyruvate dehydrogenase E1 component alpha subunit